MIVLVSCAGVFQLWHTFSGKLNETFLVKKCLELISTAIPPELPAALIIGLSLAMSKLKS
jgi:magnesium-transporting ATPase (P-type)